jgi:hypothetical protein
MRNEHPTKTVFFSFATDWNGLREEMHCTKVALRRANQLIAFRYGRLNAVNSGTSLRASCSNQSPCEFNLVDIGALRLVGATRVYLYCGGVEDSRPKMRLVEHNCYMKVWVRERERERDKDRQRQIEKDGRERSRDPREKARKSKERMQE